MRITCMFLCGLVFYARKNVKNAALRRRVCNKRSLEFTAYVRKEGRVTLPGS